MGSVSFSVVYHYVDAYRHPSVILESMSLYVKICAPMLSDFPIMSVIADGHSWLLARVS